jgi:hypothetical protein
MTNANQMETIYESAAETAKKIRKELKVNFPGIKFSVRSQTYSGGSSVNVHWEDAPITEQVEAIINKFKSGSFNGMEDIYESTGYVFEGKKYNGAKYIFAKRELSDEYRQQITDYLNANYEGVNENSWEYHTLFNRAEKEMIQSNQPEEVETVEEVKEIAAPVEVVDAEEITVTMNINEEKNGIEFSFTGIPSEATRKLLKENGFRWSKFSKIWYVKKSESALLFAESFVSAYNEYVEDRKAEKEAAQTNNIETVTVVNELNNEVENVEEVGTVEPVTTEGKVNVKSITFLWSESSMIPENTIVKTFTEAQELIDTALIHKTSGGYDKTKFVIEWSDGETYEGRIDIDETDNNIKKHIEDHCNYIIKNYAKYGMTEEDKQSHVEFLNTYMLEDPKPIETKETKKAVVLDFNSKFKQRQEEKEAQEMQSHFLNDILPYMDQEDKTRLLEAAKDTDKFNEIFQEVLIKVSFKQALTDAKKG